jgi:hypothetical protein
MQAMTPSQLTSMLVGCAKLRHYDHQLCSKLAEAAVAAMPSATGSQLAMMTWALAHLKLDMPQVFAAAAQQVGVSVYLTCHCRSFLSPGIYFMTSSCITSVNTGYMVVICYSTAPCQSILQAVARAHELQPRHVFNTIFLNHKAAPY